MTSLYPADTVSGVVTSFVPLTTVFTPPSSCSSIFRFDGASYMAFDPGYGLDIDEKVICQPPAVTTWWEQGNLGNAATGHTAVSLGPLTCPQDWQTMESSVKDDLSTAAICCPSGYYLNGGKEGQITGACLSDVSSGYKGTWAHTSGGSSWTVTTSTLTVSSSTVGAIGVVGWVIKEAASTGNLVSSSSTPTTSATEAGKASSTAASTASTSSTSDPSSATGGSLSTGATVGIGLGVALGVIGVVSLLVAVGLVRRKRQRKAMALERRPTPPPLEHMTDFKPAAAGGWEPWRVQELGAEGSSRQRSELHSEEAFRRPVELAG